VSVYNETGIEPVNLCLSGLKSGGPLLDKATIRCIMDGTQHPKIVDAGRDVILYREVKKKNIHSMIYQDFNHLYELNLLETACSICQFQLTKFVEDKSFL
jgi:hypothetical protein